jgi:hypothetical protein
VNGDQNNNGAINSGAVYVFVRGGSIWAQQAYLKANESYSQFGVVVAVDEFIVVGDDSDSVTVFGMEVTTDTTGTTGNTAIAVTGTTAIAITGTTAIAATTGTTDDNTGTIVTTETIGTVVPTGTSGTVSTGDAILYTSGGGSITDYASSSTADGSTYSQTNTTNSFSSDSVDSTQAESEAGDLNLILIIVGAIVGVLVICGLLALVIFLARRRKSNSKNETEAGDNYVSLESIKSNVNEETQYQSISSSHQSLGQPLTGVEVATSDEKLGHGATKSWEINYSELKMMETVGEGSFGTVHRAIYRHQEVAVKQLKNKINQKEVRMH